MFSDNLSNLFKRSPEDEMALELENFVHDNGFTADQLREAYYKLLGISETAENDPALAKLSAKLEKMADDGMPLNRMASLIGMVQNVEKITERVIPGYIEYVKSLDISDEEKNILRGIVIQGSTGELSFIVDGHVAEKFRIINKSEISKDLLAVQTRELLKLLVASVSKGERYGFMFVADQIKK